MERRDKTNYYLDIAEAISGRSTCLRRKFGAIICYRERMHVPRGQSYELCRSGHADANAIISASRADLLGSTLYLACHDAKTNQLDGAVEPCSMCKRLILNAGIELVIIRQDQNTFFTIRTADWIGNDDSLAEDLSKGY